MGALGPKVTLTFVGNSKDLEKKLDGLDKKASSFGDKFLSVGKGLGIAALAGNAIPIIGGVVGAVTALSGAALLVPGAALAGAAAMNTFKLATAGFGDAISAGLSGDVAKFAEATKGMAPAMKDAVGAVVAFKPQIDDLKKTVQGNFWDGFSGQITALGNSYLPILNTGLGGIARTMGGVVFSATEAANTPFFKGAIASILDSTKTAIGKVGTGLGSVLTGIVGIGQIGATYLPALGKWVGDIADRFGAWASSLAGQNQIKAWIDTGIQAFSDLFAIIGNIGSILGSVFSGLGGQISNPLGQIRELTAQVAAFLKTAAAQNAIASFGAALQAVGTFAKGVLWGALVAITGTLIALAPAVTAVATALTPFAPLLGAIGVGVFGLVKTFQGVSAGLSAYNAAMELAKNKTVVAVATTVGSWIAMAASAVANAAIMAASWLVAFWPIALIIAAVVALAALIYFNWDSIKAYTIAAWTAISSAVSTAWTAIVDGVSTAITATVGFLAALPGQVLGFLMQLPMMAATALGTLAGYVYLGAVAAWNFLWNTLPAAIGAAVTWLAGLPGMVGGALSSLASTVIGIAVSAWNGFVSTSVSTASAVLSFVATIPGRVGAFMGALPGILISAAVSAWRGFQSGTASGAAVVMSFIGTIPGRIMSFFSNAGSWLVSAGSNIVNGLINGIRNAAQGVLNYIAQLGAQIASAFAAAVGIHSPSKVFADFGVNIGKGLVVGIDQIAPAAVASSAGLAGDVAGAAGAVMAAPVTGGRSSGGGAQVTFAGNTSDALATTIMQLVRTGKIQIKAA